MNMRKIFILLLVLIGCAHNSYESASERLRSTFKEVSLPFPSGTKYYVSSGPFDGPFSKAGNEYNWNFDVPVGTPISAIEDGKVVSVFEPNKGGGCDKKFLGLGHHIKILHSDGTVSMYLHLKSSVKENQMVKRNEVIGATEMNGVVCTPQLHLVTWKNGEAKELQTIPLRFLGIPDGIARKGHTGIVP